MRFSQGAAVRRFSTGTDLPRQLSQLEENTRNAVQRLAEQRQPRFVPVHVPSAVTHIAAMGEMVIADIATGISVQLPTPKPETAGLQIALVGPFDAVLSPGALVDAAASIAPTDDRLVIAVNDGENWRTTWH